MAKLLTAIALCVLVATPCLAWEKRSHRAGPAPGEAPIEGPVLGVAATIEPSVLFTVRTEQSGSERDFSRDRAPGGRPVQAAAEIDGEYVRFYATAGPDLYCGISEVVLLVSSNLNSWAIVVRATPLEGENGEIGANRVFAQSEYTDADADEGGGVGYISIGTPRVIAAGPQGQNSEFHVRFRLKTDYRDKAGSYGGQIFFDYLMEP